MNGYNFTERVRKVLAMAREEAGRLHHEYVGTEHILLGLIREGEGVAAAVLQNLRVDLDGIQQKIEEMVKKGRAGFMAKPDLPYTSRAKKVLELAMGEARNLAHSYVGTEHLLLGLLAERQGIAAQVLTAVGADLDSVRRETLRLLGSEARPEDGSVSRVGVRRHDPSSADERLVHELRRDLSEGKQLRPKGFTLKVDFQGGYWFEQRFASTDDVIAFLRSLSPPPEP